MIECIYKAADKVCEKTRFIQKATLEYLNRDSSWTKDDVAYIFVTKGSRELNWKTPATKERKTPKGDILSPYYGLEEELTKMKNPALVKDIDIKDGKTDAEMWEVFNTIFSKIEDEDELYLDLTHSFRYLPMLLLVLCNYAKFLKKVTVKSVTYGNFQAFNDDGTHPVIDLMPLVELQDWTYAAANFVNNGVAQDLTAISTKYSKKESKETKGGSEQAKSTSDFSTALQHFVDDMSFCRGRNLIEENEKKDVKSLQDCLNKIKETKSVKSEVLEPVIKEIEKKYQPIFDNDNKYARLFSIAELCYDNGQYQAAATILQEAVITFFCVRYDLKVTPENEKEEKSCRGLFGNAVHKYQKPNDPDFDTAEPEIVEKILADDLFLGIIKEYVSLSDLRNDFNHSGMKKNSSNVDTMKKNLKGYIQFFKENLTADKLEKK
jgi:CRISPR-associated Csx2 family protein